MLCKRNLGGVTCVRQGHPVAINDQGVTIGLDSTLVSAMDGVVLHLIGQVLCIIAGVDKFQLHLWILHGNAGHLPADTPEAIDGNANSCTCTGIIVKCRNAGEDFALEQLKRGTTASAAMRDLVNGVVLLACRGRVATTNHRYGTSLRDLHNL